jgi:hypothetical protein
MLYQKIIEEINTLKSKPLNAKSLKIFRELFKQFISKYEKPKEVVMEVSMELNKILTIQLKNNKIKDSVTEIILEVNKINEIIKNYFF